MSDPIHIRSRFFDYRVEFGRVEVELASLLADGDLLIVDSAVARLHSERLAALEGHQIIDVSASEHAKSFESIDGVLESVVGAGFRKGNRLVAVGGGVVQDITAFIATTLYRGVDWLFVPTTLLAQGDSCIGGKSSINFRGYKNLLGSFLPPRRILIDVGFIQTLPDHEITSGVGEILHFLIYSGEEDFRFLEDRLSVIRSDPADLEELARRSLRIKKDVVERDELDRGERQLFNYGHSFGHAIEAVTNYAIPHGIAVSMGMDLANYVSVGLGHAEPSFRTRVRAVASQLWPGFSVGGIDLEEYFRALRRDKKNIGTDVYVILARGFGELFKTQIDLDGKAGDLIREYFANEAP